MNTISAAKNISPENIAFNDPDYPIYVRRDLLSTYPHYAAPSHWHDEVEFITVFSGKMDYNINGEVYSLKEGEGIFVNSRQMHFGFSQQTECDFVCVILHPMLLCSSAVMNKGYISPLIENQALPCLKFSRKESWHLQVIEQLKYIYQIKDTPAAPLKIQAAFGFVWALLFEHMPASYRPKRNSDENLSIVKKMVYFIQLNYMEKISLGDIARAGTVGESKCCRLFRDYLGQTPNAYLTAYRLNKSRESLGSTDMSIAEIAVEVGFCGASYYAETFRKFYGESPSEYRRKGGMKGLNGTPRGMVDEGGGCAAFGDFLCAR